MVFRAGVEKGLALGGYGEFTYQNFQHATASSLNSDEKEPRTAEADLARFVLYVGYRFSDKILMDSELEVEHGNTSKSGEMGVEFAYLDFALWKPLGFRVGELLLPVGLTKSLPLGTRTAPASMAITRTSPTGVMSWQACVKADKKARAAAPMIWASPSAWTTRAFPVSSLAAPFISTTPAKTTSRRPTSRSARR